jgi:hypothetical protein
MRALANRSFLRKPQARYSGQLEIRANLNVQCHWIGYIIEVPDMDHIT